MKNFHKTILILFLAASSLLQAQTQVFSPKKIEKHIRHLASIELEGRYPGTLGDQKAAAYIKNSFLKSGLKLQFEDGYQPFEVVTGVELMRGNFIELNGEPGVLEKDFVPLSFSKNGGAIAEVVFAGFGIVMPGIWDDFQNLDVKDKWVLILTGDPEPDNTQSAFIPFASDRLKAINAKDRGAAGLLIVKGVTSEKEDKLMPAFYDKTASDAGILVINITRSLANKITSNQGQAIEILENEILTKKQPLGFATHSIFKGNVSLNYKKVKTQNVVGFLSGKSPTLKNEYIVIGAHYDHLGFGGKGSGSRKPDSLGVHPGADDNASGVAAMLELAAALNKSSSILKRSILFVAFGAEEMGLIGAKHFVANPPVPLTQIKAMINIDMIGRLKTGGALTIGGTGTAPEISEMLNQIESKYPFSIARQPDGYGPSDHAAFYSSGIPVLFFSTGAHEDYHTPEDSWEKLNSKGQATIQQLLFEAITYIANLEKPFTFTESGTMMRRAQGRGYKVTLGIVPDVASSGKGLGVDGVRKEGPAGRAGIQKGDLIVAINGQAISNIYEYMARLNTLNAGETITVELLRSGNKVVVLVQL